MGLGIGRITMAVCLGAAGTALAAAAVFEHRSEQIVVDVACEPAVDPEEVAAVIRWASSGPELWRPSTPAHDADADRALASAFINSGGLILVPDNARAGGGKVSAIPGGDLRIGRWHQARSRRANHFTRALNRTVAPASSRRP